MKPFARRRHPRPRQGQSPSRRYYHIGAEVAEQLEPVRTYQEIAKIMDTTPEMALYLSLVALGKLSDRCRSSVNHEPL